MAGVKVGEVCGFPVLIDDSLPAECMKLVGAGRATVFRLNPALPEGVEILAQWPEGDPPPDLSGQVRTCPACNAQAHREIS